MAKMAVLVPHQEMCELAERLIGQYPHIVRSCVEYTQTEQVEARAKELEAQGCDLIMARGLHAKKIKRAVKLPVVEIRVTTQELGELVVDIRDELGLERPKIGIVGFDNMIGDTSRFDRLFHISFQRYMVEADDNSEDYIRAAVNRAVREGCDAVIGGEVVCDSAEKLGLCHRFIPSSRESLKAAFDVAERVCYAIDQEKSNNAQINTMLNFTSNGILQVDAVGTVSRANRVAFNQLNLQPKELVGQNIYKVLPTLTQDVMDKALRDGTEAYAILMPVRGKELVANIAPIFVDSSISGAILTLQEGRRILEMDSELRSEMFMQGYAARYRLEQLPDGSAESKKVIDLARKIAKYSAPVLLTGEGGSGKSILAQCIHNASFSKGNAFISLDCKAYQEDTLDTMLFGNYTTRKDTNSCMVEIARDGTIYLAHVEALSSELQFKVLNLIQGRFIHNGSNRASEAKVRVLAGTDTNLVAKVEKGEFRSDLYYALSVLGITLLPLRRRKEDIPGWVDFFLKEWQTCHKRPISLTQGALNFMQSYDWPGNIPQVNSVCERIVLLAEHRNVDEGFLRQQIDQVAPKVMAGTEQIVVFKDRKAVEIAELLKKHGGNRQKVADELGVSKTTLWRYMNKYGIDKDFSY